MNRFARLRMIVPTVRRLTFLAVIAMAMPVGGDDDVSQDIEALSPLAGRDFSLRGRSTLELWRDRERYRSTVIAAINRDDPEAAERARWVLGRWQRGILSDTPSELIKHLESLPPVDAIEFLLEAQRFGAATIALQEAAGTLDFDTLAAQISVTLERRFPVYARAAVSTAQTAELLAFLDIACTTKELAVCRRDWARLFPPQAVGAGHGPSLDDPIQPLAARQGGLDFPASAVGWEPGLIARTECLLHLIDGNVDAALAAARRADRGLHNGVPGLEKPAANDAELEPGLVSHNQQPLLRIVRMITGQWTEMAAAASASARAFEEAAVELEKPAPAAPERELSLVRPQLVRYQEEAVRHWSDALIAADRGAHPEQRQAAVAGLLRHHANASLAPEVRSLIWRTLLIHGEVDAALDVVGQTDSDSAALVALAASRGAEALEHLGFPAEKIDTQLESWIDAAIAAQQKLYRQASSADPQDAAEAARQSETGLSQEVTTLLTLIRLLDSLSLDQAAWRIADRLSTADMKVRRAGSAQEFLVRDYVLSSLLWTKHSDWMIRLGMRSWDTEPSPVTLSLVTQMTVTEEPLLLPLLMRYLKQQDAQLSVHETFRVACEIARANEQDQRNHAALLPGLAASLQAGSLPSKTDAETLRGSLFAMQISKWSDLFLAHGRADLAEPFLQDRAAAGDLPALFELVDEYRLARPVATDTATYEAVWDAVASAQVGPSKPSSAEDVMIGVQAVAKQYQLARDARDLQSADQILLQLRAMACTPAMDMRGKIADLLAECGQWEAADSIYRSVLNMSAITADDTMSFLEIARNYRRFTHAVTASGIEQTNSAMPKDAIERLSDTEIELRSEAVQWLDAAFAGALPSIDFRPEIYLRYPRQTARDELELAVIEMRNQPQREMTPRVITLLDRLQQLDQMDITSAESIFPKLKKLGFDDAVDAALGRMLRAAEKHLKSFPADAVTANNVAWGAAVNQVELPTALKLSRQAVRFEPDSAIYRDTLAEVLARLGNPAEAISIEQGSLIDDPGQWHLHEQIERFEKISPNSR